MKTIKHLFTLLSLLCATVASAHDFEVDGIYYNILSEEDKTVEVTYRGTSNSQYANEYYDSVVIPESVVYNGTTYGVTSIGNYAFYGCPDLTSIEIPNTVASIGVYAFSGCSGLTSIEIPNSVTSIKLRAFDDCTELTNIELSNSVTSVGEYVFESTAWYKNLPDGVVYIGKVLYKYKGKMPANTSVAITIKDGTSSIGTRAFSSYKSLTSIIIPNSVTSIGNYAFNNCSNLANIAIPSSIASVGADAFTGTAWYNNQPDGVVYVGKVLYKYKGKMPANTEIAVRDSTLSIAYNAFKDCSRLKSIEIPNSVTTIEDYAFKGCYELESIVIPNSVTSIGTYAFNGCAGLTSVVIGNGVTSIGSYAFEYCSGLTSILIGNSVASIGVDVFFGCSSLKTVVNLSDLTFSKGANGYGYVAYYANKVVNAPNGCVDGDYVWHENEDGMILASYLGAVAELTLPAEYNGKSVTSIGDYAFYGCTALESIEIPNSVTSIGNYAFNGCTSLKDLRIEAGKDSLLLGYQAYDSSRGKGLFYDCPLETLYLGRDLSYNTNYNYGYSPFYNKSTLTSVTIGDGVTNIGEYAFYGCSGLTKVEIPNSVTSIGNYAFNGCSSLKVLRIEDGEGTLSLGYNDSSRGKGLFYDCPLETLYLGRDLSYNTNYKYGYSPFYNKSTLTSVTIGDGVTNIGEYAFYGCSGLTKVEIPNSVTSIGNYAFHNCSGLSGELVIPDSVTSIGNYAFHNCSGLSGELVIPDKVTSIGERAFYGCSGLTSIVIGNGVPSIGDYALSGCSSLTSIVIGNGVTSIGNYAFNGCSSLKELRIEDGEGTLSLGYNDSYIGKGLFYDCPLETLYLGRDLSYNADYDYGYSPFYNKSTLTSVTIGECVTNIYANAFRGCSGLINIGIPNSVTSIGQYAFYNCSGLTNVVIGDGVKTIGDRAFKGCSSLTNIEIPNNVTNIGIYAFDGCAGLTSVVIGNSVTSIGGSAFYGCTGLTSIEIPNSVTSIGSFAFYGCTGLETVINLSNLTFIKGSSSDGYVAYYANKIINAPHGYIDGEYVWYETDSENVLAAYIGDSIELALPSNHNSEDYTIGENAFKNCNKIISVGIPNSVTSIGSSAFSGCSGLTSVIIGNGVTSIGSSAFSGCSGLTNVIIGKGVTCIENEVFYNCKGLSSIVIPGSVTSIGDYAFYGCTSLKGLRIEDGKDSLSLGYRSYNSNGGYGLFYDCPLDTLYLGRDLSAKTSPFKNIETLKTVIIGNSVTSIGNSAFYECTGLKSVVIGNSVTSIGSYAFYYCSSLTSIEIPNSVTSIRYDAFHGCSSLTSIEIPNSVTSIGSYVFSHCTSLASIEIPNSVTRIVYRAFFKCSNLANVVIGDSVKYIESEAFYGCSALTGIVFPDNLAGIHESAFENCSGLTYVVIGNGLGYIRGPVFSGCTSLKTVINFSRETISKGSTGYGLVAYYADKVINAPNGYVDGDYVWAVVNEENTLCGYIGNEKELVLPGSCNGEDYAIGNSAFYNCTGLTSIEIPSVITDIKDDAFYGCTGLKEVHISDLTAWCNIYFASADANPLYYAKNLYLNGDLVTDVVVPDVLPEIHKYAFINCSGLTNVMVTDGVDVIGESAFSGCRNIETLYISNSIYTIGDNAFAGCNKIYDIKVGAQRPIGGNVNIFASAVYDNATLYIPGGTKSLYEKREPWNRFFYIKEMNFTGIEEVYDEVKVKNVKLKGVCYDMQGRVVENPTSGIYIINGKKVLVK